jgi:hypothetical protein
MLQVNEEWNQHPSKQARPAGAALAAAAALADAGVAEQ